jgi:hypothetical protein
MIHVIKAYLSSIEKYSSHLKAEWQNNSIENNRLWSGDLTGRLMVHVVVHDLGLF